MTPSLLEPLRGLTTAARPAAGGEEVAGLGEPGAQPHRGLGKATLREEAAADVLGTDPQHGGRRIALQPERRRDLGDAERRVLAVAQHRVDPVPGGVPRRPEAAGHRVGVVQFVHLVGEGHEFGRRAEVLGGVGEDHAYPSRAELRESAVADVPDESGGGGGGTADDEHGGHS